MYFCDVNKCVLRACVETEQMYFLCMRDRVSKAQGAAYFRIRQHSKMISTFQRQGGLLQVIHIL